jgi:hypothetical protein
VIGADDYEGTIAGGYFNGLSAGAAYGTIGGGQYNTNSSNGGTIAGGQNNLAKGQYQSTVGGGYGNTASASYATVPGGFANVASGAQSFAAGTRAQAVSQGAFVWADSQAGIFTSTAENQFLVRAGGGVGINTASPQQTLSVFGGLNIDQGDNNSGAFDNGAASGTGLSFGSGSSEGIASQRTTGTGQKDLVFYTDSQSRVAILNNGNVGIANTNPAYLLVVGSSLSPAYCNGTVWQNGSDQNAKRDFSAVDAGQVLDKVSALPITQWRYKSDAEGIKHLGPMAQDFHTAFGLNGPDDKHIATVDEGGVALAAIQGLNRKLEAKEAVIQQQAAQITDLKARLDRLERFLGGEPAQGPPAQARAPSSAEGK